jgi:hypothetical protein
LVNKAIQVLNAKKKKHWKEKVRRAWRVATGEVLCLVLQGAGWDHVTLTRISPFPFRSSRLASA